jgi:hypothetical protein
VNARERLALPPREDRAGEAPAWGRLPRSTLPNLPVNPRPKPSHINSELFVTAAAKRKPEQRCEESVTRGRPVSADASHFQIAQVAPQEVD